AAEYWVRGAQGGQRGGESGQFVVPVGVVPVDPAGLVVLAVDVVVPGLGASQLVAVGDHGYALGEQQGGQQVALLALPQREDGGVGGWSFHSVVPRPVVGLAVAVVLPVGVVVFVVVGDQVCEGEPVVRGDEVDRREGSA